MDNSIDNTFFNAVEVKRRFEGKFRTRIDTLLTDRGLKWSDCYNDKIKISKSHASLIRNAHIVPPDWLRKRIATALKCDVSDLWKADEIVADNILNSNGGKSDDKQISNL